MLHIVTAIQDDAIRQQADKVLGALSDNTLLRQLPTDKALLSTAISGLNPDVLIVDLLSLGARVGDTIRELRNSESSPEIVVLHSAPEGGAIVEAMRAGAREFLFERLEENLPATVEAIRTDVESVRARAARTGKLFAFFAAKGGCGVSTVVTHSATALHMDAERKVLLADLNFKAPSAAFLLGAEPLHTLDSALNAVDRLDATLWNAIVIKTPGGVAIAPPPAEQAAPDAGGNKLKKLVQFWKRVYGYTLADCGAGTGSVASTLVAEADEVVLVTSADVVALQHARRMLRRLPDLSANRPNVRLVINRMPKRPPLSTAEIEKLLDHPVFATISNDYEALTAAWESGTLLPAGHALNIEFQNLAYKLAGEAVPPEKKRRFRWFA